MIVQLSIGLPTGRWLNVSSAINASPDGLDLGFFEFGRLTLPPQMVMDTTEGLLNLVLGDGLGTVAFQSVDRIEISEKAFIATVEMSEAERKALAASAKGKVRSLTGASSAEEVRAYWNRLRKAEQTGSLKEASSLVDYLRFTVADAADQSGTRENPEQQIGSAIIALSIYCGSRKLQALVGDVVGKEDGLEADNCRGVRLADRVDLMKHFIISAALQVASDAGAAFAIGEFKELLDANKGGSGFSFDDIAGDYPEFCALAR